MGVFFGIFVCHQPTFNFNNFANVSFFFFWFRDEIAACTEKAYRCISFPEATRILYFESEKDMKAFADKV